MAEDFHDKTEEPTPKKLLDARKKGFVAKSSDLSIAFMLLGSMILFFFFGPFMYHKLETLCLLLLNNLTVNFTQIDVISFILWRGVSEVLWMFFPLLAGVVFMAILFNILQTGLIYSYYPLKPKWKKLNIFNPSNYEHNFGMPAFIRLFFGLFRLTLVMILSWIVISSDAYVILNSGRVETKDLFLFIYKKSLQVGTVCSIAYIIVGIFDYFYQKWRFTRQMRMSRREVKEELKQMEGDLTVKNKIRANMRLLSETSFSTILPNANVIIADGDDCVVAICYIPGKMQAPICLCKGTQKRGMSMRDLAKKLKIPIVEDPYLARSIYRTTEQGDFISSTDYNNVASILARSNVC